MSSAFFYFRAFCALQGAAIMLAPLGIVLAMRLISKWDEEDDNNEQ